MMENKLHDHCTVIDYNYDTELIMTIKCFIDINSMIACQTTTLYYENYYDVFDSALKQHVLLTIQCD